MHLPVFISVPSISGFYGIGREIGAGGGGKVHEAYDRDLKDDLASNGIKDSTDGDKLAIKCMPGKSVEKGSNSVQSEAYDEGRIHGLLNDCAFIVHLHLCLEDLEGYYLLMEKADFDLFDVIKHANTLETRPDPCQIMFDVLKGLQHLHSKAVIHRDLKAENCLIFSPNRSRGRFIVKLCDFGLACVSKGDEDGFYGTKPYMVEQKVFLHHKFSKSHPRKSSKRG